MEFNWVHPMKKVVFPVKERLHLPTFALKQHFSEFLEALKLARNELARSRKAIDSESSESQISGVGNNSTSLLLRF
jgi:hypothetical protein